MTPAFDCDGTILDTLQLGMDVAVDILDLVGETARITDRSTMLATFGRNALIARYGPEIGRQLSALHPVVTRYRLRRDDVRPFPGINELLASLPVPPPVFTASFGDSVAVALARAGAPVGAVQGRERGSKTALLADWARATDDPVYICDTATDLHRCRSIDLPAIGVTWGYDPADVLTGVGWGTVVMSVDDLAAALGLDKVEER